MSLNMHVSRVSWMHCSVLLSVRVSITFVWLVSNCTRIYILVFTVQDSQGVSAFEMTYIVTVSGWALSSTHSLKSVGYWCMIPSCQISLLHFLATCYG